MNGGLRRGLISVLEHRATTERRAAMRYDEKDRESRNVEDKRGEGGGMGFPGGRGGIGCKPMWSAVPLCAGCHALQHNKSHLAIMTTERWLELADKYLSMFRQEQATSSHKEEPR